MRQRVFAQLRRQLVQFVGAPGGEHYVGTRLDINTRRCLAHAATGADDDCYLVV